MQPLKPQPRKGWTAEEKDLAFLRLAEEMAADRRVPEALRELAQDARVQVRRAGVPPPEGRCIVYWMQRAQRGRDNHALDVAIAAGNSLGLPVVAYFAAISNFPHANLRHYAFLGQGLPDAAEECAERNVGFVLRRAPQEDPLRFFTDVKAAMVIGDENPLRGPELWRMNIAQQIKVPFWTVDADVIIPSRLLEKAQFNAAVARPRLLRALPGFLTPYANACAQIPWRRPRGLEAEDVKG
ncbi:MAG: deoxyribodipyrimidine photo-lyase, partial [Acidobacteriota bacterium]